VHIQEEQQSDGAQGAVPVMNCAVRLEDVVGAIEEVFREQ
jgi:hypothetical protein